MRRFANANLPDSYTPILTSFVSISGFSVAVTYAHLQRIVQQECSSPAQTKTVETGRPGGLGDPVQHSE
jgi:hypothetical protein